MKTISATASSAGVITGWVSLIHHRTESIFQRPKSISEQNQHWSAAWARPANNWFVFLALSSCRRSGALRGANVKCLQDRKRVAHQTSVTNLTFIAVFRCWWLCAVNLHFMLIFCQVSPPSCFPWLISPLCSCDWGESCHVPNIRDSVTCHVVRTFHVTEHDSYYDWHTPM